MAEDKAIAQYRIYKMAENERIASVNTKRIKSYPAAKIGRFAVAESMKGKNNGSPFYLKNGFVPLNEEDKEDETRLLYFDLNDVS